MQNSTWFYFYFLLIFILFLIAQVTIKMMNQLHIKAQPQQENQNNKSDLNYSFLIHKMDQEDRLKNLSEIQRNLQEAKKVETYRSFRANQIPPLSPPVHDLRFSVGFNELSFKNTPSFESNKPYVDRRENAQKKINKMVASVVKQEQPMTSNLQQISDQSQLLQEDVDQDKISHFNQASISESMDDFIFNPPMKKLEPIQQLVHKMQLNKLPSEMRINVIDSKMNLSTNQIFNARQKQAKIQSANPNQQLLAGKTSSVQIPQHQNILKDMASSNQNKNKDNFKKNIDQSNKPQLNNNVSTNSTVNRNNGVNTLGQYSQTKLTQSVKKVVKQEYTQRQPNVPFKPTNQIEIRNRMKSTYDQKINTQFNLLLNQGNFSEPDDYSNKKISAARESKIVDFQENLFEQEKKNSMKQEIVEKIKCIEEAFINIRASQRQRCRTRAQNERVGPERRHHDQIQRGNKARMQKMTEPIQDFPHDQSYEDGPIHTNRQQTYSTQKERSIMHELKGLRQKLSQIEQQTSRTLIKDDKPKLSKKVQKMNVAAQVNYKGYNHITVKNYTQSSQSNPPKIKVNSNLLTNQEFGKMQTLLTHFKYQIFKQTSVNQIVQMCFEIIQLFSLQIDSRCPIGLIIFKDCVQIQFEDIGMMINWKYNGQFYIGTFKDSMEQMKEKQGQGIQLLINEYIYKGNFANNKKTDFGMIFHSHGSRYRGNWSNNLFEGKGILIDSESTYQGYFSKGMKSKKGIQKFASGDAYEGEFAKDKFNGKGRYVWDNSTYYNGSFVQGLMHGYGYWKSYKGDKYEGNYMKNMKHGNGVYISKTGKVLKGKFEFGNYAEYQSKKSEIQEESELITEQVHIRHSGHQDNLKGKHYHIIVQELAHQRKGNQRQQ